MTNKNQREARDNILYHLQKEPYLTAKQLAILRRPDEKACLTSDQKPKNLSGTTRLLKEMAAPFKMVKSKKVKIKPEIEFDYYSPTDPTIYRLPSTTGLREPKLKHELMCGDLYVAFHLTGQLDWWEEPKDYDSFGLKPDRQMIWNGRIVFFEVDRGTEDYYTQEGIKGKLDRYRALSLSRPDRRFNVCFTTVDNKQSAETRCAKILELIETYKRADQFMVTLHKWAVQMPDLACWMTDKHPMGTSLLSAT